MLLNVKITRFTDKSPHFIEFTVVHRKNTMKMGVGTMWFTLIPATILRAV